MRTLLGWFTRRRDRASVVPPAPVPRPAPAARVYLREADAWKRGETSLEAVHPFRFAVMSWWTVTPGAKRTPVDSLITEYVAAGAAARDAADPGWTERTMRAEEYCRCGATSRVEHCAYCTHCMQPFASCCSSGNGMLQWDNGNSVCPRCGEGELVG